MKELIFDMQKEHRDEWIAINYPEAEEGSKAWDHAIQEYQWFQDWLEEAAEQAHFEAKLASIPGRLHDAKVELQELERLLATIQPDIVLRMAFVHVVTVLDSFLMYSARALLSHSPHLQRFMKNATKLVRSEKERKALLNKKWFEQEPGLETPEQAFTWRAQAIVSKKTFQNPSAIKRYFELMLSTPHAWDYEELGVVIDTRNDLVHRNGFTLADEPVHIWPERVADAILRVSGFIEAAAETLLQEDDRFRDDGDCF
ncbi:hypothetical protein [Pantoea sp. FN0307]|uniref:hypothetical protein n=1 Tax=Pantoea sp. FN0307 TaxID=3418560 RepID=UPI003CEEB661